MSRDRKKEIEKITFKEGLLKETLKDLEQHIEQMKQNLKSAQLKLVTLKENECDLLSQKFQVGDKVFYRNTGFFETHVGTVIKVKTYDSGVTWVFIKTSNKQVLRRSPKNLDFLY